MAGDWLGTSLEIAGLIALSTLLMYVAVLVLARIGGLRSFAEMSAFDFAMTIALGTIIASTATAEHPTVLEGAVALLTVFGLRFAVAYLRLEHGGAELVDNTPLLLMEDGRVLEDNLRRSQVSHSDLMSRLRIANVGRLAEVRAVVLETTGTVSVITRQGAGVDEEILEGVER